MISNYEKTKEIYKKLVKIIEDNKIPVTDEILAGSIFYLKSLMKLNEYEEAYNVVSGYINKNISEGISSNNNLMKDFYETYIELLYTDFNKNTYNNLEETFIISQVAKNKEISNQINQSLIANNTTDIKIKNLIKETQKLLFQKNNLEKRFNLDNNSAQSQLMETSTNWEKLINK